MVHYIPADELLNIGDIELSGILSWCRVTPWPTGWGWGWCGVGVWASCLYLLTASQFCGSMKCHERGAPCAAVRRPSPVETCQEFLEHPVTPPCPLQAVDDVGGWGQGHCVSWLRRAPGCAHGVEVGPDTHTYTAPPLLARPELLYHRCHGRLSSYLLVLVPVCQSPPWLRPRGWCQGLQQP